MRANISGTITNLKSGMGVVGQTWVNLKKGMAVIGGVWTKIWDAVKRNYITTGVMFPIEYDSSVSTDNRAFLVPYSGGKFGTRVTKTLFQGSLMGRFGGVYVMSRDGRYMISMPMAESEIGNTFYIAWKYDDATGTYKKMSPHVYEMGTQYTWSSTTSFRLNNTCIRQTGSYKNNNVIIDPNGKYFITFWSLRGWKITGTDASKFDYTGDASGTGYLFVVVYDINPDGGITLRQGKRINWDSDTIYGVSDVDFSEMDALYVSYSFESGIIACSYKKNTTTEKDVFDSSEWYGGLVSFDPETGDIKKATYTSTLNGGSYIGLSPDGYYVSNYNGSSSSGNDIYAINPETLQLTFIQTASDSGYIHNGAYTSNNGVRSLTDPAITYKGYNGYIYAYSTVGGVSTRLGSLYRSGTAVYLFDITASGKMAYYFYSSSNYQNVYWVSQLTMNDAGVPTAISDLMTFTRTDKIESRTGSQSIMFLNPEAM